MRFILFFILFLFSSCLFAAVTLSAQHDLVTPRDVIQDTTSNVVLQNSSNAAVTVYGVYVRQYADVASGSNCDSPTVLYSTTENKSAGAVLMPTVINAHKSAAIGANYLYNMIYQAIYYQLILSVPGGCQLPGCTWGTDSTIFNWCIYLGALAPSSSNSPSYANAYTPPSTDTTSSTGVYNYNLVTSYHYIGPISFIDQTLTCTVSTQQTQSFS